MRGAGFAAIAIMLSFCFIAQGCAGQGASAGALPQNGSLNESAAAPAESQPAAVQPPAGETNGSAAQKPAHTADYRPAPYVNYCYTTYWKGQLLGKGHQGFYPDRCGEYDYSMNISVIFTMPFDMGAALRGEDFNFNDCPGVPQAAKNGSGDISIDGSFKSEREITSKATGIVDRSPDTISTSSGALYISSGEQGLLIATFPNATGNGKRAGQPHLVASRCTWENGIQVVGMDQATLYGADWGSFSFSQDGRAVDGLWGINNTVAGSYALSRTD